VSQVATSVLSAFVENDEEDVLTAKRFLPPYSTASRYQCGGKRTSEEASRYEWSVEAFNMYHKK
jgi:hypothetical protein